MFKYVENFLMYLEWYTEERANGKKLYELRSIWTSLIANYALLNPEDKEIASEWLKPLKDERVGVR